MTKRIFCLLLAMILLVLPGCSTKEEEELKPQLNIIDDNVRNWYEIFVYSFYDSNNDGVGDLNGVTAKLDYIQEMGFNGIWLMPIHPSPTYHKYDVNDYYAIDPEYGTLEDFDRLVTEAHKRGIKVIIDLVLNHSSSDNPWFKEACQYIRDHGEVGGPYGEYYNFHVGSQGGDSPVDGTNYYYESRFWSGMPDLNLDSAAVRNTMQDIMRFWLVEHNIDGFRLDAVTSYYTGHVDRNVEFLSWVNTEAKKLKSDCYIVGEAWEGSDYQIGRYYESGVDSFFLFTGATATGTISTAVKQQNGAAVGKLMVSLQDSYKTGTLAPFLGNHDTMRPGSFLPGKSLKLAAGVLSMMNGNVFVYYGEEIGMISKNGNNSDPAKRIAMKWSDKSVYEGWCYVSPEGTPVDESSYVHPGVDTQLEDPDSILNYYKQAMYLRNCFPAIARGKVENFPQDNSCICVVRKTWKDESVVIVINLDSFTVNLALDKEALGVSEIAGTLLTDNSKTVEWDEEGNLALPAGAIVILK